MQSNICKIEKGTKDLAAILHESEKVAIYNELDRKQALQLRLICEEIDGMLPELIGNFEGKIWIEFAEGVCKVNVSIDFEEFSVEKKEELIGISKNKQNASAVGITGKIRSALENTFLNSQTRQAVNLSLNSYHIATGYVDYSYLWSLEQYKGSVNKEEQAEAWDELEKSVIASVADDIVVGVKGTHADIVVVKKFA